MNNYLRSISGLCLSGIIIFQASAQSASQDRQQDSQPASIAFRIGSAQLYGDLNDLTFTPFVGETLMMPITKIITIELPVDYGSLQSQQNEFYHSTSKAQFIQVAAAASVNVLEWFKQKHKLAEMRPYAGVGLQFFQAEARDLTTGKLQRLTNNEGSHRSRDGIQARGKAGVKMTHELVWLIGMRGSTALSRRMSVFGDIRLNLVRTDKLDATLDRNNNVLMPGSPAYTEGNHYGKNSNDKWSFVSVGVNYYFGERFKKN